MGNEKPFQKERKLQYINPRKTLTTGHQPRRPDAGHTQILTKKKAKKYDKQ